LAGHAGGSPNVFEVLVEDTSTDSSSDDSCFSDVPFDAAMEVVASLEAPGWSTVVWRGRRTDEELAVNFRSDFGFPTPASRVWEDPTSSRAGKFSSVHCRGQEE
jgi:hypothetical protein